MFESSVLKTLHRNSPNAIVVKLRSGKISQAYNSLCEFDVYWTVHHCDN